MHEGEKVREFYSQLPRPVLVGIEATGSMQWFLSLMDELGIECRVGNPAQIRAAEPRKLKHDRRDADLIPKLLVENRFPAIWLPSKGLLDLRALLLHRHQWVRMRIQNSLQAIALANGLRRGPSLRKVGIRLWIMLRDKIDYQEFCRRGQMRQKTVRPVVGMPETGNGAKSHRQGYEATHLPES